MSMDMSQIEKYGFMEQMMRIEKTLITMELRLDAIIEDRHLDITQGTKLFADYSPFQLEEVAVPIVTLFIRHSMLLGIFESHRSKGLNTHRETLTAEEKEYLSSIRDKIKLSRKYYVDGYGRAVLGSFYEAILVESHTDAKVSDLETLLVRYFGSAYPTIKDSYGLQKLQTLLFNMGKVTKREFEAETLIKAVGELPIQMPVPEAREKDKDAINEVLTGIEVRMRHLRRTLDRIIKERGLERPYNQIFRTWSYIQFESLAIYTQNNFSRASLLMSCWEAELKYTALQYNIASMPRQTKQRYSDILDEIAKMRGRYIDEIGTNVLRGLMTVLQVKAGKPANTVTILDNILITFFGVGMSEHGDYESPAFCELSELLDVLGKLTGKETEAQKLLSCVVKTSQLEPPKPL